MTGSASDREHPRYAHEAVITLNAPGMAISGRTSNLSRGGLCATLSEQVPVGVTIDLDSIRQFNIGTKSSSF